MINKLINRYKSKYLFEHTEDKEAISHKNIVHMARILFVFFIFSVVLFAIFIFNYYTYNLFNINAFIYYVGLQTTCLLGCTASSIAQKKNSQYILGIVICYTEIVLMLLLCLFSVAKNSNYNDGYMLFAIVVLLSVVFFDINPLFLSIVIIISDIFIGLTTLSIDNYRAYINLVILSITVISLGFWKRSSTIRDLKQKRELSLANKKSEDLLLNLLPKKVIEDLRETGSSAPELYKDVSILFTDIVNFTKTAKDLEPAILINELNDIFSHFDQIVDKHNCTRIKTIGDAYLAVCGLPESDPRHAANLMNCAKDFIAYLTERNETSEIKWKMRIGINSGEVIAGIVGIHKYIYDIFGDAVNVASRVESLSESMKINISESTYQQLQGQDVHFTTREIMDVKGKGKMQMYFVE